MLATSLFSGELYGHLPGLAATELNWLAERLFENECASQPECLTSWNPGEEFPSLGIGHFIWIPEGRRAPFEETFPALIRHIDASSGGVPAWLLSAIETGAPWSDRAQFNAQLQSPRMRQLRQFLLATQAEQTAFVVKRFNSSLPAILATIPASRQATVSTGVTALATSAAPWGHYALIDYLHFKGTGLKQSERYAGHGWGLAQVLAEMGTGPFDLESFVAAASTVLRQRVANSPPERNEQRWLAGWQRRLSTYLPAAQSAQTLAEARDTQ